MSPLPLSPINQPTQLFKRSLKDLMPNSVLRYMSLEEHEQGMAEPKGRDVRMRYSRLPCTLDTDCVGTVWSGEIIKYSGMSDKVADSKNKPSTIPPIICFHF